MNEMKKRLISCFTAVGMFFTVFAACTTYAYDNAASNFNRIDSYYGRGMYYEALDEVKWLSQYYKLSPTDIDKTSKWQEKLNYALSTMDAVYAWFDKIQYYCDQGLYYEAKDELNWLAGTYTLTPCEQSEWDSKSNDAAWGIYKHENGAVAGELKQFALNNLTSIYDPEFKHTYNDVRFLRTDITGDGVDDLLAVGLSRNEVAYMEIYYDDGGNISRIWNDHCLGAHGGASLPIWYNGRIFLYTYSYSSGTGFLKKLLLYNDGSWKTAYYSRTKYTHDYTSVVGYLLNDKFVSYEEYNDFNNIVENSALTTADFSTAAML